MSFNNNRKYHDSIFDTVNTIQNEMENFHQRMQQDMFQAFNEPFGPSHMQQRGFINDGSNDYNNTRRGPEITEVTDEEAKEIEGRNLQNSVANKNKVNLSLSDRLHHHHHHSNESKHGSSRDVIPLNNNNNNNFQNQIQQPNLSSWGITPFSDPFFNSLSNFQNDINLQDLKNEFRITLSIPSIHLNSNENPNPNGDNFKDLKIKYDKSSNSLLVSGKSINKQEEHNDNQGYHFQSYSSSGYQRNINLPSIDDKNIKINHKGIKAWCKEGALEISVPKIIKGKGSQL